MSKKSPQLRFEGFTDNWEERKLGDTETHFTDGNYGESYPSAKDMSDKANGIPFLRGSDFSNGYLDSSNANYIKPEKHAELTSGHIKQDDIVLAVRGSLGTLGYATKENEGWNINSQLAILRTNKSEISGMFLIQYLLGSKGQKEIFSRNTGTALKQLPIKQLKDIPVPVPTLLEQQKIGNFFKELDGTIALHQRKLDLLKEQKKGYLQKMFPKNGAKVPELRFAGFADDWEERKFESLLDKNEGVRRGPFGSALKKDLFVKESPYVVYEQQNAIYDHYETRYNISKEKFEELHKFELIADDFIMSGAGTIGRISKVPKGIKKGVFNQALIRFRINKELTDSEYFLQFIRADFMQRKFTGANPGSAITNLVPMSDVKKWEIKVPIKEEQKKIGSFFKQLDETIALHQRKLDLLKEQKKGFLQTMFAK
ncbi:MULTISPECIES: restriction endonuclease subunit S [Enterococcus]|uniref:restriction endonuclease subunit S n=1 Tax=Enterococcus TaxID=1350 RepID=UPI00211CF0C5|nr:restriction endonuclease subunit S [Enterococcus faecium]MDQ8431235.1 restriction endonuclease subunit S [Enterococcus faecium]MDQ8519018.1 restriction endonuclease subunit S [Enterococcus faecium]MDV4936753.1 restriction endonuclease subunit S [Enterococcus faecium]